VDLVQVLLIFSSDEFTLQHNVRKPVEVIRDGDHGRSFPSSNSNGRIVEFDLPKAMRICRTPGSR
jgi:hypothetical protein